MATKRGLTLGKFAPLHRGHQLVIETALSEMDEVAVIVYDAPDITEIPLDVRAGWIQTLYPDVKVIEAKGGPRDVGYTPELMKCHEDYIINELKIRDITHFYSSELYGEHMSKALGARNRSVDPSRSQVPVSGTEIRQDPFNYREYIDPVVYRDLITKVAILGAPSTGKTTLAQRLADAHDTVWMMEYGRKYWEEHQVDRRLSMDQLVQIAETHIQIEDQLILESNRYLFADTSALTTRLFGTYYHDITDPRLDELADQSVNRYDLYLVCDIDIPYHDTWDRSGRVNRDIFQEWVIQDLMDRGVRYSVIRGSMDERIQQVADILRGKE